MEREEIERFTKLFFYYYFRVSLSLTVLFAANHLLLYLIADSYKPFSLSGYIALVLITSLVAAAIALFFDVIEWSRESNYDQ